MNKDYTMNKDYIDDKYKLNPNKWVIAVKPINKIKKKYFFTTIFFIICVISVSIIKNETRELEKEINNMRASISEIRVNLHEATLEHQVITSPENISELAKNHLEPDFTFYKSSQIKNLNGKQEILAEFEKVFSKDNLKKTTKRMSNKVKIKIAKKIEQKKLEMQKLQELYSQPEKLPNEIKLKVAKKIQRTKVELKELYEEPKDWFVTARIHKWAFVQLLKAMLGIPVIPGR